MRLVQGLQVHRMKRPRKKYSVGGHNFKCSTSIVQSENDFYVE
jgi:hypothetical protein